MKQKSRSDFAILTHDNKRHNHPIFAKQSLANDIDIQISYVKGHLYWIDIHLEYKCLRTHND